MRVTVLAFASLGDALGQRHEVELDEAASVADLLEMLVASRPELRGLLARAAVAINRVVVPTNTRLDAGAEVALLPPVSGG